MFRRPRGFISILRISSPACGAVLLLLISVNRPHGFWTPKSHLQFLIGAVIAIGVLASVPEYFRLHDGNHISASSEIEEFLKIGLVRVSDITSIQYTKLGLHAYVVARSFP